MQNTAPFVFTPLQAIRPAEFSSAMRGKPERDDGKNRWFLFRKSFELSSRPENAPIRITCDGRYQLFVNGVRAGRGPARCNPLFQRTDAIDIAPWLAPGRNVVGILMHCFGVDTAYYEQVRGSWRHVFGEGGLFIDGFVRTGPDMRVIESTAWRNDTKRSNHALDFIEDFDARALPKDWALPGFDDSAWPHAQVLSALGGGAESPFGGMRIVPFPILIENELPPMVETDRAPKRLVWARRVVSNAALPPERRIYEEEFLPGAPRVTGTIETGMKIETPPGEGVSLLFDFGRIMPAYPFVEIEAKGGETVEIAVSERLPGEFTDNGMAPDARITRQPLLGLDAHVYRAVCAPGVQMLERFAWAAVKWMQITISGAAAGVVLRRPSARETHYPAEPRGAFTCSDPLLNTLWETGRATLRACMHDGWIDCPSREQRQWLGDATVENLAAHAGFGPSIAALNAAFLRKAAESQRPDGLTQMFAPGDHGQNGMLIPDWTLQWILNARDHHRLTGETGVIAEIMPSILRALAWFTRQAGDDGRIADTPYWQFHDWAGLGRAGISTTLNALLAGALEAGAELCEVTGDSGSAKRLRGHRVRLCAALNAHHWDEIRGVYTDTVDPRTGQRARRVSQHANAAMMLWADAPPARWARIIARITDPQRLTFTAAPPVVPTGETLDEENGVVLANTFFAHFIYEALARAQRFDLALDGMRARFGPMLAAGASTLWESFAPTASLCHGFSAGPTYHLSAHILGVTPAAPGFAAIRFEPDLCGLDFAKGAVPTAQGDIHVALEAQADGFIARLDSLAKVEVIAPAHHRIASDHIEARLRVIRFVRTSRRMDGVMRFS